MSSQEHSNLRENLELRFKYYLGVISALLLQLNNYNELLDIYVVECVN